MEVIAGTTNGMDNFPACLMAPEGILAFPMISHDFPVCQLLMSQFSGILRFDVHERRRSVMALGIAVSS